MSASDQQKKPDDEIQDIMREIESLQKGLSDATQAQNEPVADEDLDVGLDDFRASDGEPSMEETLGAMKSEEPAEGSLLDSSLLEEDSSSEEMEFSDLTERSLKMVESHRNQREKPMHDSKAGDEGGCLTLTLQGNMSLKLQYEVDSRNVVISFGEGVMQVMLADGTEFKIPLSSKGFQKAA